MAEPDALEAFEGDPQPPKESTNVVRQTHLPRDCSASSAQATTKAEPKSSSSNLCNTDHLFPFIVSPKIKELVAETKKAYPDAGDFILAGAELSSRNDTLDFSHVFGIEDPNRVGTTTFELQVITQRFAAVLASGHWTSSMKSKF